MVAVVTLLLVRFFTDWVDQVKAEIPADRLLVFEVKQVVLCFVTIRAVNEPLRRFRSPTSSSEKIYFYPTS